MIMYSGTSDDSEVKRIFRRAASQELGFAESVLNANVIENATAPTTHKL